MIENLPASINRVFRVNDGLNGDFLFLSHAKNAIFDLLIDSGFAG